ncbi:MAG: NUDIX hydrolase [Patescibacteria group bacterium]
MNLFTENIISKHKEYIAHIHTGSFEKLDLSKVTQVYGLILNQDNKLLVVYHSRGDYLLPGGSVEKGESLLETLNRECYEEASIYLDQDSIKPAFYQKIVPINKNVDNNYFIQVRYLARLKTADKFIKDEGGDIVDQKWIDIDKVGDYLNWGKTVGVIQDLVTQYIG